MIALRLVRHDGLCDLLDGLLGNAPAHLVVRPELVR